ncbi:MAG: FAD-dependent oxidoreductase [Syntrophobacteraceae bacterium]|jgi:NADPH-dependent glutamate synthase beta subunit-like oxidoreductase/glutamate synthase domain-containing protein 3/Pyruvate/2-oxoacid:ferredoxin oxidoreductase delta subunit
MEQQVIRLSGFENGHRIESRILEERIQQAVENGYRTLEIEAFGQHGIGGRLWKAGNDRLHIRISGAPGQRVGSMGFPNTLIEVLGPSSDDVGWLNGGAEIVIHGHATNGVANAMAQGKIYVAGNIGARGMTMTKHNPRFAPPELWVLGSAGDYFAEFMAGGIAVVCGYEPQDRGNVLGFRPCVGMVGGRIFFRGPHKGYSKADAKLIPIEDGDWEWLAENLKGYLTAIGRIDLYAHIADREDWQLLQARGPLEKYAKPRRSMEAFHNGVWDSELGRGGLIGDLVDFDRSQIPLITTGFLRRYVPVWENRKFAAPCEASCPTGMPVHERWRLIREGRADEAVDLALAYTPFPASVCGYLCPNLCMQGCTRQTARMIPVDITQLGKASLKAKLPELPPLTGKRIAVIGGGPSGISVAWQLRRQGHEAIVYDMRPDLGGKISAMIPRSRIPDEIVEAELARVREALAHVNLRQRLEKSDIEQLREEFDFIVVASGAQRPRVLPIPGKEKMVPALEFLRMSKAGEAKVGKRVLIIGAGNVGCDAAAEAHRLGAEEITLIDIQEPLSFGKERKEAEAAGAKFRWPCFSKAVTEDGLELTTGEVIPADTIVISVGDAPELDFLPESVETERGFIKVNEHYQTSDPKIFAIGDTVRLGLLTDAIGAGRKAAGKIGDILSGKDLHVCPSRSKIEITRVKLEYFDPRISGFNGIESCASQCSSCGTCRDCGICVTICPESAISRQSPINSAEYEMVVDPEKCIGCGFCAGACPCGVWDLVENEPID